MAVSLSRSNRVRMPVRAKKSGSNSTETSMSRRSRRASCQWGTRGKQTPARKAPKSGWTPILSVAAAESSAPATTTPNNSRVNSGFVWRRTRYAARGRMTPIMSDQVDNQSAEAEQQRGRSILAADEGQGEGQQAPGHHVIDGRAEDGGRAQGSSLQIALFENARQHRESGDAHGDAQKKHKRNAADAVGREADAQGMRQQGCPSRKAAGCSSRWP